MKKHTQSLDVIFIFRFVFSTLSIIFFNHFLRNLNVNFSIYFAFFILYVQISQFSQSITNRISRSTKSLSNDIDIVITKIIKKFFRYFLKFQNCLSSQHETQMHNYNMKCKNHNSLNATFNKQISQIFFHDLLLKNHNSSYKYVFAILIKILCDSFDFAIRSLNVCFHIERTKSKLSSLFFDIDNFEKYFFFVATRYK